MSESNLHNQSQYSKNIKELCRLNHLAGKLYRSNPFNNKSLCLDITIKEVHDLLESFNRFDVKYILIGGMAGVVYGHIRTALDMDVWVKNDYGNTKSLVYALSENDIIGSNLVTETPLIFGKKLFRFRISGFELDLGHTLKAFLETDFDYCYSRALQADLDGISFPVIKLEDLIIEKGATGTKKDIADIEELLRLRERGEN